MANEKKEDEEQKTEILYMSLRELKNGLNLQTGKEYKIILKPCRIYLSY